MKYVWEDKDIKVGRYFCLEPLDKVRPSTIHKIGYLNFSVKQSESTDTVYVAVAITDGLVWGPFTTKREFVDVLNENGYIPAHHGDVVKCIKSLRNINEGY